LPNKENVTNSREVGSCRGKDREDLLLKSIEMRLNPTPHKPSLSWTVHCQDGVDGKTQKSKITNRDQGEGRERLPKEERGNLTW